ncbi:MAG TPA: sensor histidine kinase [Nitrospira sp.]|nr:sensor histidine kinase [Nitrospira sp. NTP1]HQV09704.1 sensor histidine kinase [Nitrospira sp.]
MASFNFRQDETGEIIGRPTDVQAQRRQRILVGLAGLLACLFFVLDLQLPLGVANAVLYSAVVLLSSASQYRWLPIVTATACSLLTIIAAPFSPRVPNLPPWFEWVNHLFSLFGLWAPVVFIYQRRRTERLLEEVNERLERGVEARTADLAASRLALERSEEQLHTLTGRILTAQEEERRRIAQDLHDDVNQRLALLMLELQRVDRQIGSSPGTAQDGVHNVLKGLEALSDDVRYMAYRFHPSILDDLGLKAALQRLLDDFSVRTGVKALFVHQPLDQPLDKTASTALYRVVQESLSNIARHAKATRVEVEVTVEEEGVVVVVRDDGKGFDQLTVDRCEGGLGLLNMRERLLSVQGTCEVESSLGKGTTVSMYVPLVRVAI